MTSRAWPWVALGAAFAVRVVLAATTDVYADEAYYWTWSHRLDWSYFDHPPLVAWLIAALGIRGAALACGAAASVGVFLAAREATRSEETALWATAVWSVAPAATLLGTLATPDAPLLAAWAFALWGLAKKSWWLVGLAWGLAMLAKYNGILLAVPVLVVFWRRPAALLGAGALAATLASPIVWWNAQHDWEGFRFQLHHGLGGGGGFATFGEFVLGQLGMGGVVLVPLGVWWMVSGEARDRAWRVAAAMPVVFFGMAAFRARGEANWAAAAWMAASLGVAESFTSSRVRWAAALAGLVPTVVLGVGLAFPPEVALEVPAVRRLHGWSALESLRAQAVPVFSLSYQLSSEVTRYAGLPASTLQGRRSQYDLWPRPVIAPGGAALWVCDPGPPMWEEEPPPAALVEQFERVERVPFPAEGRQAHLHRFGVWRLEGFRDQPPGEAP